MLRARVALVSSSAGRREERVLIRRVLDAKISHEVDSAQSVVGRV
jgi:hypothetical protein